MAAAIIGMLPQLHHSATDHPKRQWFYRRLYHCQRDFLWHTTSKYMQIFQGRVAIERLRTITDYHDYVEQLSPDEPTPELMNGRFVMAACPTVRHARYVRDIMVTITAYLQVHHADGEVLADVEVVLDDFTLLVPDVAYAIQSSTSRIEDDRIYGAPDFVCEIASPSTRVYDAHEKFLAYFRAGVREYWLVDPFAEAGARFTLYERIEKTMASTLPTFQQIAGGPALSRIFPGIAIPPELL